jgi:hypothetical protein
MEESEIRLDLVVYHPRHGKCVVKSPTANIHGYDDIACVIHDEKDEGHCVFIKDLTTIP